MDTSKKYARALGKSVDEPEVVEEAGDSIVLFRERTLQRIKEVQDAFVKEDLLPNKCVARYLLPDGHKTFPMTEIVLGKAVNIDLPEDVDHDASYAQKSAADKAINVSNEMKIKTTLIAIVAAAKAKGRNIPIEYKCEEVGTHYSVKLHRLSILKGASDKERAPLILLEALAAYAEDNARPDLVLMARSAASNIEKDLNAMRFPSFASSVKAGRPRTEGLIL